MRYPEINRYISNLMLKSGMTTGMDLFRKVEGHMGHEFLRLIVNGEKLPEVEKAKVLAKALNIDFVEFLCVIENARLRDRGAGNLVRVVPVNLKKLS
jgi:hypothetical protein